MPRKKTAHTKKKKKSGVSGKKPASLKKSSLKKPSSLKVNAPEFVPKPAFNLEAEEFVPKPKFNINAEEFVLAKPNKKLSAFNVEAAEFIPEAPKLDFKNAVALDCEMVGVGKSKQSALAHIAIVDYNGKQVYNKYVIPDEPVTSYRTEYSGITRNTLKNLNRNTHSFSRVKEEVHKILEGKVLVGHGLINDFKVLEYDPKDNFVWDTAVIPEYQKVGATGALQARKLKNLAKNFVGNIIQTGHKGHSPLEDARASMNLYRINMGDKKVPYKNMATN